jgi:uncharacterized surface protein with fasciclin (FAS1) repeats
MNKYFMIVIVGICMSLSCRKVTDSPLRTSIQMTDTAGSLIQALDSSSCHLFDQAFHRAALDTALLSNGAYTMLAPTDSAMEAAGLTSQVIGALSVDSLMKIVRYHITHGAYSDVALLTAPASVQAPTLLVNITLDTVLGDLEYQQNVYLKENTVLYANGEPVGTGAPGIQAYNGYLYTINKVLTAPSQSVWQIISTDPRLDMYTTALRIDDSLYIAMQKSEPYYPATMPYACDSSLFSKIIYSNVSNNTVSLNQPTVFAPTDSAFYAAGFHSVADIRAYALSTPLGNSGWNSTYEYIVMNDIPMDSILYAHIILNQNNDNPAISLVLYNDLQFSPLLNEGLTNSNTYQFLNYALYWEYFQTYPLNYSVSNNIPYIQWNPAVPAIPLLPNTDPLHPRHYLATNGAVYLVNQLFTSPN